MKFLITNDDGFDGPGLAALFRGLEPLGEVRVVAPSQCHSAKGHAVNTHSPIRVERKTFDPFGPIQIVEASPADCVRIGLRADEVDPPDFVIAGINTGANLGVDLFYSGTAAAAREAAILGVPAIALSRYMRPHAPVNWESLASHVTRVVRQLTDPVHRLPIGQFWNVNFPAIENDAHPDEITFAPQGTKSHHIQFVRTPAPSSETSRPESPDKGDVTYYAYGGDFRERGKTGECDVSHLFDGKLTATAIDLCTTAPGFPK